MLETRKVKDVILGKKYRDTISGLIGVAICYSQYLTGCDQVSLETLEGGEIKEQWFDITRLDKVPVPSQARAVGGPQSHAPAKIRK